MVYSNYGGPVAGSGLPVLESATALGVGALTDRGWNCRLVQVTNDFINDNDVTERILAGTYVQVADGTTYPQSTNLAGMPSFVESGVINYNIDPMSTNVANAVGHLKPDKPFPGIPGLTGTNMLFAFEALGYAHLLPGRIYRWGVASDDGFRVFSARSALDTNAVLLGQFNGNPAAADTVFSFLVTEKGLYPVRLTYEQHLGNANLELWDWDMATGQYSGLNDPSGISVFQPGYIEIPGSWMTVTMDGMSLRVSWTAPVTGSQRLLSSGDLNNRLWTPVDAPVVANGLVKSVTITPLPTTNVFFRVQQQ
jgi:hypothetical protein